MTDESAPSDPHEAPTDLPSVFVLGDSISLHYGSFLEKALQGFFRYDRKRGSSDDIEFQTGDGANGGDSRMVLEYLRHRAATHPIEADILLLNCGLHDIKLPADNDTPQVGLAEYEQNLREILDEADRAGLIVAWVRTTQVIDAIHQERANFRRRAVELSAYNAAADDIMIGRPSFDLETFTRASGEEAFSDHVHFIPEVREKQGVFLAGCLHGYWSNRC